MAQPQPDSTSSHRDFYLAAAMLANGAHFLRVDRQGNVGFFVFAEKEKCERLVAAYFQGDLMVRAKDFTSAIRSLKDALFSVMPHDNRM